MTRHSIAQIPLTSISQRTPFVRSRRGDVAALARSVRTFGVLTPLLVTEDPGDPERYLLLKGQRRVAAAQEAGLTHVPVLVMHGLGAKPQAAMLVHLAASCAQPRDALDRARVAWTLVSGGRTHRQHVAVAAGLPLAGVTWLLSLLDLDPEDQALVRGQDTNAALLRAATHSDRGPGYFGAHHPAADLAAGWCEHAEDLKINAVACGPCWERALVSQASAAADDDAVAGPVARVLHGEVGVHLTADERRTVVRVLAGQDVRLTTIAARLGVSTKTVSRDLARLQRRALVGDAAPTSVVAPSGDDVAVAAAS